MIPASITYADLQTQQVMEGWGVSKGFDVAEQFRLHMEERFRTGRVEVVRASERSDVLILHVVAEKWQAPREFGMLPNGSLAW